MRYEEHRQDGVVVVTYAGELDASTLPEFSRRIEELIEKGDVRVVLDLPGLSFLVSAAFGYFLRVQKELVEREGALVISRPSPFLTRLMGTFGVADVFPIYDSVEESVRHFDA